MPSTRSRRAVWLVCIVVAIAGGSWLALAQSDALDPKDFESNSLLFVQQDVLPSFGQQSGVRLGTIRGLINGTITTNFFFTVPPPQPPGGQFTADDNALVVTPEGDQIAFTVHAEGTASYDTLDANIVPFRAPFIATYTVTAATGKLSKYVGRVFPARGTGTISTMVFFGSVSGTPVGTVYVEVSRNPIR